MLSSVLRSYHPAGRLFTLHLPRLGAGAGVGAEGAQKCLENETLNSMK